MYNNSKLLGMRTRTLLIAIVFLFIGSNVQAQFWKKITKKAEQAAEQAVIRKTGQKVTKETEKAMDTIFDAGSKKKKKSKNERKNKEIGGNKSPGTTNKEQEDMDAATPELKAWSKYNFVPGDEIIFEDDLAGEENGEFPSRWDLAAGNAENAKFGEENIIRFENRSIVNPLMETEQYLPEVFTVEFDAYFNDVYYNWQSYGIRFWQGTNHHSVARDVFYPIEIFRDGATTHTKLQGNSKKFDAHDPSGIGESHGWKHIAISFNKRSLKVFVDEYRALNIPNYQFKPKMISIGSLMHKPEGKIMAIKNIRIAEGGKKLYDRVMEDGKFVTRGILFDVNKATIKPASSGTLNEVAKMMKAHTELNFRIEGHTDSDGDDSSNLKLSESRAAAVKNALIAKGIDGSRLLVKGMGEGVPIADNESPEGKANNRRVEFVKI